MFRTKSRTEQLQEQSATATATLAHQLRERAVPVVALAENAKDWGQPRVEAARVWVKPHVEHGIVIAAPKLESAVSGIAPKVDTARDKIVDDLLPRVTEAITSWAAASTAAKDEVMSRGHGAAAVLAGGAIASPKRKNRNRLLILLGLLSASAAAVVAFMRSSAPKDDPWATPIADPYVAPSNGRHPKAAPVEETTVSAGEQSEISDSLEEIDSLGTLDPSADADLVETDGKEEGSPR